MSRKCGDWRYPKVPRVAKNKQGDPASRKLRVDAIGSVRQAETPDTTEQRAKFVLTEPGVADDAAHDERVHRVVSGNRDNPDSVGHDDVLALPGDPKPAFCRARKAS